MLTLYRSNRAEVLVQLLAAHLSHPPPGPLEPVQVVVNTWPTSRWLGEALALHLGGIAAHLRFPFPGGHLRRVVQLILADGEGTERQAEADPWRAIHLVWAVMEELPALAATSEGEILEIWLRNRPLRETVELPHWQLARAIADALDDYALYRPDLLAAWEQGGAEGENGQLLPSQLLWQPVLYRRLRKRLGVQPFGLRVQEVIRRLRSGQTPPALLEEHLGKRLRLFGPSTMAPIQVHLLHALAASMPVDLYLLSACPGLWQRCTSRRKALSEALALRQPLEGEWMGTAPPLEARFGRMGAEFQQLLEGTGETQLGEEREEDLFLRPTRLDAPRGETPALLHQLQEHLLGEEPDARFQIEEADHSLEFHACPGLLRQVQILRDRLLQLLAADPTLEPRQILVMTPSVETFAPLVATVFGDGDATGVDLPWRLTDRSQEEQGGIARCLLELLSLAGDRLTASGLERILACGALQRRFGLDAQEAEDLTEGLQRHGFRWGLGAADRQGDPTHSLGWVIDRLLLGLVLPEPDGTWETATAPARPPGPLDLGGRSLHLLLRLRHWLVVLTRPRPCGDWVQELRRLLDDLFSGESAETEIPALHSALEEWQISAGACLLPLEPAVVGAVLKERLSLDSGRFGHRSGALTISALEPMRAIPHRVVVLMGLDAGVFPRQRQRPGFHLLERSRRLGDPDPADQDRYALLEALLSARDTLLISWNCRDERTGMGLPPAAPVQQMLQWLEGSLVQGDAGWLQVQHEPNPLAPENFQGQGRRPPASCDRRSLEACRLLERGIHPPAAGLAQLPSIGSPALAGTAAAEPLETGDPYSELRLWLMEPQKVWLRQLGMVPQERREAVEDLEALELEERERAALLREALSLAALATPDPIVGHGDLWLRRHRGEGRFPPAQGAALEATRLEGRWTSLRAVLDPLGEPRNPALRWGPWEGCPTLRGDAVVMVLPTQARVSHLLDLWLQLQLAAAALAEDPPGRGLLIARGKEKQADQFATQITFAAPAAAAAQGELHRLWELRRHWQHACWPVPPETGWCWICEGKPEPGDQKYEPVAQTWEGSNFHGNGERQREEMQVCFGSQRTLDALLADLPFRDCASTLLDPIHQAVVSSSSARR